MSREKGRGEGEKNHANCILIRVFLMDLLDV